jgi:hypothetical protein
MIFCRLAFLAGHSVDVPLTCEIATGLSIHSFLILAMIGLVIDLTLASDPTVLLPGSDSADGATNNLV